mmetsp:Transcript_27992/g.65642  ORF Transcript_27992/g.65642 Transcript_27992/m.65642 type:complete len:784 (-) Transcript_27992:280-2631(-)
MGAGVIDSVVALSNTLSDSDRLELVRRLLGGVAASGEGVVASYPTGYILYAEGEDATYECSSWLLAPGTNLANRPFLAFIYLVGLAYIFLGIAIISDIFMAAIEVITASEGTRRVRTNDGKMIEYTFKIFNPTVANLTLMALGSSAPEILLAIIGVISTLDDTPDELGPSTIVGSAAFNLLLISAICISALPEGETKKIDDLNVFLVTAFFSVAAYVWLYIVLQVSSPHVVELWEAIFTLGLFGLLLGFAYVIDVRGRCCRRPRAVHVAPEEEEEKPTHNVSPGSKNTMATQQELMEELRTKRNSSDLRTMPSAEVGDTQVTGYVAGRTTALRGLTGQRRLQSHDVAVERNSFRESKSPRDGSCRELQGAALDGVLKEVGILAAAAPSPAVDVTPTTNREVIIADTPEGSQSPDGPKGELHFEDNSVMCEEAIGKVKLSVVRTGGDSGHLTITWMTRDGTAKGGTDYIATQGSLTFAPGELRKILEVEIIDDDILESDTTFTVELNATASEVLAARNRICSVTILDDDQWGDRMHRLHTQLRNALAHTFYAADSWSDRFKNALELSGGVDEETGEECPPTRFDTIMHALSLFWKLQFALVPPESWAMGWPAFVVSLIFIGIWTAIVGELASLFGCVIGLGDAITAITFVALGTSLPDTFASRLATLHDEHADAAIGNITGSNSVNVFLGLGIPWIIGALYHRYAPRGKGQYDVPAGSLGFSLALFSTLAAVALLTLLVRRHFNGGELGGSRKSTRLLSLFFVSLWVIYIVLASLNDKGYLADL